ncbi:hypothetical protein VaNZ11_007723 [Volvox africanus]|uniref:Response regulatory domain-containing protein n=1 Tax=Volvox africanus TaxID=51714 RepID=A0ABQ5S418_9CHLO|nr:hypothetical protein VaNZ11_007723 [Volvox africanus]
MATAISPAGEAAGGQVLNALNPSDIHVLLVDDERLTRLVVGNLLRTCKYKVTIAESGTQALEVLSKAGPGAFQLILTDVIMPDVGGLELLRFVRSHQHLYNVPVIMMSASEAQETMCAALLGSADEYLVKPVTRKEVQNIWMHVMKRYHHAAAVQPAAALEAPQDPTPSPATGPAFVASSATGGVGGAIGGLIPLVASSGPLVAGLANSAQPAGAAVSGPPLLSLGQGVSLGLSPRVARDMMRAVAVAAGTTAATATGPGTGGSGPASGYRPVLSAGLLPMEDGQVAAMWLPETDPEAGAGPQEGPSLASAEGSALMKTPRQHQCTQRHQLNASQQHAGCSGHAVQKPGGGGGQGASKVNLLKWLRRSNRCVQPKESFWIFCEVLLLLDSCQAVVAGLRPSKLELYSNGRVAFAPPSWPPAAAAAAITVAGPVKGGGDGAGGSSNARRKRRRHSAGQLRGAAQEEYPSAAAPDGSLKQEQALQGAAAAAMACNRVANAALSNDVWSPPEAAAVGASVALTGSAAAAMAGQPVATPAGSHDDEEDALYRSPEEAQGHSATQASDMFSLGLLFFELFYVCAGEERAALLRDARQRVLPPSFARQQPKEAAFALALLHPDPACRPTLAELLGSAMFRATCASLRQKAQRPGAPATAVASGAAAANRREQPHHHHHHHHQRHTDHHRQHAQAHRWTAATAGASAGYAKQQHPEHRLANASNDGIRSAAAAAEGSGTADARARDAAVSGVPGVITRLGGPPPTMRGHMRVDDVVLLEFLHMLRKRKLEELAKMDAELAFLTADAQMVEQYLQYLHQTRTAKRQRGAVGGAGAGAGAGAGCALVGGLANCGGAAETFPAMLPPPPPPSSHAQKATAGDIGTAALTVPAVLNEKGTGDVLAYGGGREGARLTAGPGGDSTAVARALTLPHSAAWSEQHQAAQSKWCRIAQKYEHLEPVFLERCRRSSAPVQAQQGSTELSSSATVARRHADAGGLPEPLLRFAEDLAGFATFTTLTPTASLQYADPHTENAMVAGAAFDRDDEFFALAGVNKRIKIFEREAVLQSSIGTHYPVLEISSRSRLSSVTWSSYIKGHLASADYEGVVQLWDTHANSELMQFEEHRRRVWSVDFSQADPARLLSGGDDGLVKLWSIQQDNSTSTIELNANVCSVQFSPTSPHVFAAGCANSHIFLYDIRNIANPLYVLTGHTRAVSYVRFLSPTQLVSASTDNTLRLWQLDSLGTMGSVVSVPNAAPGPATANAIPASCTQVFRGHVNERNFTGLSLSPDGYITCGSENNRVFCYYPNLPMPVTSFDFSVPDPDAQGSGGVGAATAAVGGTVGGRGEGRAGQSAGGGLALAAGSGNRGVDCGGIGASKSGSRSGTGQFVSSVCWSRRSNLLLAANSVGMVKLLTLH